MYNRWHNHSFGHHSHTQTDSPVHTKDIDTWCHSSSQWIHDHMLNKWFLKSDEFFITLQLLSIIHQSNYTQLSINNYGYLIRIYIRIHFLCELSHLYPWQQCDPFILQKYRIIQCVMCINVGVKTLLKHSKSIDITYPLQIIIETFTANWRSVNKVINKVTIFLNFLLIVIKMKWSL